MLKLESDDILNFWFQSNDDIPTQKERRIWFFKKHDKEIKSKFSNIYLKVKNAQPHHIDNLLELLHTLTYNIETNKPREIIKYLNQYVIITFQSALATVILFDQMAKNMFRNEPESFKHQTVISNFVWDLFARIDPIIMAFLATPKQFFFLALCLIHYENTQYLDFAKDYSIKYFENYFSLIDDNDNVRLNILYPLMESIQKHKSILLQFGRYPKRNAALSRISTEEELSYIKNNYKFV